MEQDFWVGHRERLREKAEQEGLLALKDREVVELILFFAQPRTDMADLAQALLDRTGSLGGIMRANRAQLMAVPGMTRTIADWVLITSELVTAYLRANGDQSLRIWCFRDMILFLARRWPTVRAPQTWILYTDMDHYMMTYSVICESLYWWDPVYIRDIVMEAMSLEATHAFLILFMGIEPLEVEPWEIDCITAFSCTMRAIGVELLDCVLVGHQGYRSLNVDGCMDEARMECLAEGLHERYCEDGDARGAWDAGI